MKYDFGIPCVIDGRVSPAYQRARRAYLKGKPLPKQPSAPLPEPKTIGEVIHRARKARGLTLKQLESLTGSNYVAIWRVEKARAMPDWVTVVFLARALDLDLNELAAIETKRWRVEP